MAGVDLALPIERQVVGVLAYQDMGHQRFGGQPALDQSRWCWRLDHRALARPAAVLGPAGDDHPERGRDHVEALRDLFADPMHRAVAARAGRALRLDHHLVPRQVLGQRPAIYTALLSARRLPRRVALLRLGRALRERLLEVLECQLQLIGVGSLLGAPSEQGPLQLFDDRPQLLVVPGEPGRARPFGQQQRLERRRAAGRLRRAPATGSWGQWITPRASCNPLTRLVIHSVAGSLRGLRPGHPTAVHPLPVEPLEQRAELARRQPHHPVLDPRPDEPRLVEPLVDQGSARCRPRPAA